MILRHVGLVSSSEEKADVFYADLLGLIKSEPKLLSLELAKAIFNVDRELVTINYQDAHIHFEIFFTGPDGGNSRKMRQQPQNRTHMPGS